MPSIARSTMNKAAPIDIPGTKSGRTQNRSTVPGRRMEGSARPTAVATTAQMTPTSSARTRLASNGPTQRVSLNSAR